MKSKSKCPSCQCVLEFDRAVVSTVKCPKCAHRGSASDFTEIQMKTIKCSHCNTGLKVAENAANKDIPCPKCKKVIAAPKDEEGIVTVGPGVLGNTNRMYRPGKLELLDYEGQWLQSEKIIPLMRGENTIGRKASGSKCSIQLPTTDVFLSKNHAKIEVMMTPDAAFVHRLSDMGSTNGTFHNGDRLEQGEVINLIPNDTIRIGHTTFKFISE